MAAPQIIDLRRSLPTAPGQGSGQRYAAKRGQVLHYSAVNYPNSRSMEDILRSEAELHTGPYLSEAGIAYHWGCDWRTPTLYRLRDEDEVLWHCGYWGTPGNRDGLSIHVPGGNALMMTPEAKQALVWLFRRNEDKYGFGREALKGHREVGESTCPGPLMGSVIYPYRAGTLNYEGDTLVSAPPIVDPVTGHTVHPGLADSYDFATWGRPLLPAVLYSDGKIRQLYERGVYAVGSPGHPDTLETLGHAFLYATGGGDQGTVFPSWPGVVPLV
jgi:hypothetical protein